jgi:hypothetical protein
MKNYYYADQHNIQQGPFDLEELRTKPINRNTLVWHSGLSQWTLASQVKELSDLFEHIPPTLNVPAGTPSTPTSSLPPRTWLIEAILVTICCCTPLGIVGIVYAAGVESKWRRGMYAEALQASAEAGRWVKIGFGIGICIYLIGILSMFVFPLSSLGFPFFMHHPFWHV